jgi:hypothetical protein
VVPSGDVQAAALHAAQRQCNTATLTIQLRRKWLNRIPRHEGSGRGQVPSSGTRNGSIRGTRGESILPLWSRVWPQRAPHLCARRDRRTPRR